jgi:sulfur carrier protein
MKEIQVTVNGRGMAVPAGTDISSLLESLGVGTGRVAVERNREIVPRAEYTAARLENGDALEIVEFVGGG